MSRNKYTPVLVVMALTFVCTLLTGCPSPIQPQSVNCLDNFLSEERARAAVDELLAKGEEIPDNCCPPATLEKWLGFVIVSDAEMHAKAIIQHYIGKASGSFIFNRTLDGGWALTKIEFLEVAKWGAYWEQTVYYKVK